MPTVDYDSLSGLIEDEIKQPADEWTIDCHEGSALGHMSGPLGKFHTAFHVPFTKVIHLATWEGVNMHAVTEEVVKISENRHHTKARVKEDGKYVGSAVGFVGTNVLSSALGVSPILGPGVFVGIILGRTAYKSNNGARAERQARAYELEAAHARDIVFPPRIP
jgi:hypothetical protein